MIVRFTYDYMGRRVRKQVFRDDPPIEWLAEDLKFVYDGPALDTPGTGASQGWNVVMVLDGLDGEDPGTEPDNVTVRKYTWGLDMSGLAGQSPERERAGGIHGAGGTLDTRSSHQGQVGGLLALDTPKNRSRSDPGRAPGAASQGLACEEPQATGDPKRYWFFYDANGNVGQVLRYAAGSTPPITRVAHYEYDPYGQALTVNNNVYATDGTLLAGTGYANDNPFRFSTKWLDTETALAYYGYRYYSPRLGRWLSRDPIEEEGAALVRYLIAWYATSQTTDERAGSVEDQNPYAALRNAAVGNWDPLGLVCGCRSCRRYTGWGIVQVFGHTWIECDDGTMLDFYPGAFKSKNLVYHNWSTWCTDLIFEGGDTYPVSTPDGVGPPQPKCMDCKKFKDCMKREMAKQKKNWWLPVYNDCIVAKDEVLKACGLTDPHYHGE